MIICLISGVFGDFRVQVREKLTFFGAEGVDEGRWEGRGVESWVLGGVFMISEFDFRDCKTWD